MLNGFRAAASLRAPHLPAPIWAAAPLSSAPACGRRPARSSLAPARRALPSDTSAATAAAAEGSGPESAAPAGAATDSDGDDDGGGGGGPSLLEYDESADAAGAPLPPPPPRPPSSRDVLRAALLELDTRLASKDEDGAADLATRLAEGGVLRGFGRGQKVPKRDYSLAELKMHGIDGPTLLSPRDATLDGVRTQLFVVAAAVRWVGGGGGRCPVEPGQR